MKTWTETLTLAALAVLFTLPLAGCAEDGPDVAAAPDAEPGDPAIYAPDGWPLQIGDRISGTEWRQVVRKFPAYQGIYGMHLVGDRIIYGARFTRARVMDTLMYRYEGHFPAKAQWVPEVATALVSRAQSESLLPERFRGKIEYEPPPAHVGFKNGEPYLIPELLSPMHAQREEERRKR